MNYQAVTNDECKWRIQRFCKLMDENQNALSGCFIFSRVGMYYFTGTFAQGALWISADGEAVLLCRKGVERAQKESPLKNIVPFRSFSQLTSLITECGVRGPEGLAGLEEKGLSFQTGSLLLKKIPKADFVGCDQLLAVCRSVKSAFELKVMRRCGRAHQRVMEELLPQQLKYGMSEFDISRLIWELSFDCGHEGVMRMSGAGEEIFLGHVCVSDSGNYPSAYNGPLGLRGVHPAAPHMGSRSVRWEKGMLLSADIGFAIEGYHTDKTHQYWAGESVPVYVESAHSVAVDIMRGMAKRLRPGVLPEDIYSYALDAANRAGYASGFMGLGGNKVPFAGHGIGLCVDEFPVIANKFRQPLEENMVLALEPKIGLPDVGMVGLENTFLVTPEGGVSLTGGKERQLLCV